MHTTTRRSIAGLETDLDVSAATDTGLVRSVNEDSLVAEFPVFLVADGMGGHDRGDQASRTVAAVLREHLVGATLPGIDQVLDAIEKANGEVVALTEGTPGSAMSGTTLAGVSIVVAENGATAHWMAFNIGDSRIYSWDGRTLVQLTVDHSAVQELVDAGTITEADARTHPDRNIITRAVGARANVDADIWLLPASSAQGFLICSDGLTKEVDDGEIARLLACSDGNSASSVAEELVAAAVAAGGRDNVTAVVVIATPVGELVSAEATAERRFSVEESTTPRLEFS